MITLWISEAEQVMREVIGTVGSSTEYNVLLGLAIVGFLFALFNISAAMGSTMSTPLRVLGVGVIDHDEDTIKRLVDFLLEVELDLAEFTVLTPFPHTRSRAELEKAGRILHNDWRRYTASEVVFQPALMSPDKLAEMHQYAWDTFYADCSQELRMARLFMNVMRKETADGTYKHRRISRDKKW